MIHAALYPRKSKAVDNSDSMETQVFMCREYLNQKYGDGNYDVEIYDADYGITGHSTEKRKDFQRMMADVKKGKINLVVIQRYDRIARNLRDFCNLFHDMEQAGCDLVSVSQQIDTTTPYGKNFMYMQASMAELEWALTSERRKDALRYAAAAGKCTLPDHSIQFGYKAEIVDGVRRLVINEERRHIVYEIFDLFGKSHNYYGTAQAINNKYGTNFTICSLKKLIRSPFYKGSYRGNDKYCEPYLSPDEWDRLQIKRSVIREDYNKKGEIMFTGLLICPSCGHKLRALPKRRGKAQKYYRYYVCQHHELHGCPNNKSRAETKIEKEVIDYVSQYVAAEKYRIEMQTGADEPTQTVDVERYRKELERLNMMYQKGRIDDNYYDTEYLRLTEIIAKNEANTQPQKHKKVMEIFEGDWQELYEKLDLMHKKLFWREIIKEIHFTENMEVSEIIFL